MSKGQEPTTLQEAVIYFANPDNCLNYLVARRWPNGVTCPTCGSDRVGFLSTQRRWQCSARHPKRQFSVKVGTIFEDSPLGLAKWKLTKLTSAARPGTCAKSARPACKKKAAILAARASSWGCWSAARP